MFETKEKIDPTQFDLRDTVVSINRVTKVVKGGKNLSFSALVIVGDGLGHVGFGVGKAKEVPSAIQEGDRGGAESLDSCSDSGDDDSTPPWSGASVQAACC